MAKVRVRCPKCGREGNADESFLGKWIRCPKCDSKFALAEVEVRAAASSLSQPPNAGSAADARSVDAPRADDQVPLTWSPGDVILDLYEVKPFDEERDYAEGGMGRVYRVLHRGWNLDMAVKSPLPENMRNAGDVANFEREAETWIKLGLYPHTVACYYVRRLGGIPRVFAEFVTGGSLKEWIDSGKLYAGGQGQALERILDIAIQFAWGLHHAHEQGLVHQDIKPANVLLTDQGIAKVTDFGLARARAVAGESATVKPGRSILISTGGMTPAYCSPEQAARGPLSRKTDIWSWAISVLEMFTGDVSWPSGAVAGEALESYLEMGPGDAGLPAMPSGVADLLRQCLRRDPQSRLGDMREVAKLLQKESVSTTGQGYLREEPTAIEAVADTLNLQAVSLMDLGSDEISRGRNQTEALALWERALRAAPHHLESVYNFGLCQWRAGRLSGVKLIERIRESGRSTNDEIRGESLVARIYQEGGHGDTVVRFPSGIDSGTGSARTRNELENPQGQEPSSCRCLHTMEGHKDSVTSVALSRDGRLALSGSADLTMRLWDLTNGRCLRTLEGHADSVTSVALSDDGRLALSGSSDETMRLWDLADGRCLRTLEGHSGQVTSAALSVDGRYAISGNSDETSQVWDLADGECRHKLEGHTRWVHSVSLSADGRYALTGSSDQTLRLWSLTDGRCLRTLGGHRGWVLSVALSRDGRLALSGSKDQTLRLWDLTDGRCLRSFEGHSGEVLSVSLSGDGRYALSGSRDKTVRLWDLSEGRCLRVMSGHMDHVTSVVLDREGRYALSGSDDRTLRVWSTAEKPKATAAFFELSGLVGSAERHSAAAKYRNSLAEARRLIVHGDWLQASDKLKQARMQVGYGRTNDVFELWSSLYLHRPKGRFKGGWAATFIGNGHVHNVLSVALSGDGRLALSGSFAGPARLWDLNEGRCLRTLECGCVRSVTLSHDGRLALVSGRGGTTLSLWDVADGRCVYTRTDYNDSLSSAALSGDGRFALLGDGTAKTVSTEGCG